MAGHQLKKLAQSRGKVIRSSLIDLVPKHWSVYTLLFSTVFFLLFCFLLFDIRTSPTALLLHASNQLGALRAQAGEMYFQSTSGSGSSDLEGSPNLRKGMLRRAEDADDDDDDDDEKRKSNSFNKRSEDGGNKAPVKDRWTTEEVPTEGLLVVDGRFSDKGQPEEGPADSKDRSVVANVEKEDAAEKFVKTVKKLVDSDSTQEEPADVGGQVPLEEPELENESTNEETVLEKESSEEEPVVEESVSSEEAALDIVKPDGGEEGIEVKVEKSPRKKDEGKELRATVSEQEVDEASAPSTNITEEDSSVVDNSDSSSGEEKDSGSVDLTGKATKPPSVEKVADEELVDSEKVTETKKGYSKRDEIPKTKGTSKKKSSEPSTQEVLRDVAVDGKCEYSVGKWVYDESYPLYAPDSCPFVDGGFRCVENGRPSAEFQKYRWQPSGCDLPRFDPKNMLERLRGRRLAFVGDSIGRNNWESLLCMLAAAVPNKTRIYEINGEPITKHKGFLSFRFEDYDCTVEYYRSPYLVPQGRAPPNSPPEVHSTFKLDQIDWSASQWKDADIIVFNSGHWWSFEKTVRGGGTWKTGGSCVDEERPMLNHTSYQEPWVNQMISEVIQNNVKSPIKFLNITLLSDYRPDGHSSIWQRTPPSPINRQDCSHWCLPGVPDTWNEFLYAALLDRGQGPWGDKAE
ncbi:hypothetical protein Mapa_003777 [Marchantia paleacea]|nr:hypothetical protein Mapa_003777 [Marchantia paleacea]